SLLSDFPIPHTAEMLSTPSLRQVLVGALALHVSTALQHPAANERRQLGGLLGGLGGLGGLLGGGQEGQEAPTDGAGQGEGDVVDGMDGGDAAGGNGQEDATGKSWPSYDVLCVSSDGSGI